MSETILCPNCKKEIDIFQQVCPYCNAILGLAAALEEHTLTAIRDIPLVPEILVPRIGEFLLEEKLIGQEDLQKALTYQKEEGEKGRSVLLGQALLELGMISRERLDEAITKQILLLHATLKEANQTLLERVNERTRELQDALSRLSELSQLKANFIANISHELRTPLTQLRGYLEILASGNLGELSASQKEIMDILLGAENRLEQLIDDLIQFSMASRGELQIHKSFASLGDIAQETLEKFKPLANDKRIALLENIEDGLPEVSVDRDKISWVLQQLLDNALKFTPEGGRVELEIIREDGLVSCRVSDSGMGIPQEELERIFEPFHQLDTSSSKPYSGRGLGLAMSRQILQAHGSSLQVKSEVGHGSCFEFKLPSGTQEEEHTDG